MYTNQQGYSVMDESVAGSKEFVPDHHLHPIPSLASLDRLNQPTWLATFDTEFSMYPNASLEQPPFEQPAFGNSFLPHFDLNAPPYPQQEYALEPTQAQEMEYAAEFLPCRRLEDENRQLKYQIASQNEQRETSLKQRLQLQKELGKCKVDLESSKDELKYSLSEKQQLAKELRACKTDLQNKKMEVKAWESVAERWDIERAAWAEERQRLIDEKAALEKHYEADLESIKAQHRSELESIDAATDTYAAAKVYYTVRMVESEDGEIVQENISRRLGRHVDQLIREAKERVADRERARNDSPESYRRFREGSI